MSDPIIDNLTPQEIAEAWGMASSEFERWVLSCLALGIKTDEIWRWAGLVDELGRKHPFLGVSQILAEAQAFGLFLLTSGAGWLYPDTEHRAHMWADEIWLRAHGLLRIEDAYRDDQTLGGQKRRAFCDLAVALWQKAEALRQAISVGAA